MIARMAAPLLALTCALAQQAPQITMEGATYQVRIPGTTAPVVTARIGAQIDGQWIYSTDYPQHRREGQAVIHTAAAGKPDLVCSLRPCDFVRVELRRRRSRRYRAASGVARTTVG